MSNHIVKIVFAVVCLWSNFAWSAELVKSSEPTPDQIYAEEKVQREKLDKRVINRPCFQLIKDDPKLPRVLLIGDSISMGYTDTVRQKLAGKANVHRPMNNCGQSLRGLKSLKIWLGSGKWDVIHFNWGLHDIAWQKRTYATLDDYKANLEKIVEKLKESGAKLIWASTTPVPEGASGRRNGDEVKYNAAAAEIMKKHGIEINDLYSYVTPKLSKYQIPKNVHFKRDGSIYLGEEVTRKIEEKLPK